MRAALVLTLLAARLVVGFALEALLFGRLSLAPKLPLATLALLTVALALALELVELGEALGGRALTGARRP